MSETPENPKEKFFRLFNEYLEGELGRRSVVAVPGPVTSPVAVPGLAVSYEELDKKTKAVIDKFMDQMRPDIEKKAVELLKNEVRDKIARTGNINKIIKAVKAGKKPSLKRKKGCIYLQLGSGDPNDQIEEFIIATT
ncbi:unnamed protein product, partial [marine sediment metagenome]